MYITHKYMFIYVDEYVNNVLEGKECIRASGVRTGGSNICVRTTSSSVLSEDVSTDPVTVQPRLTRLLMQTSWCCCLQAGDPLPLHPFPFRVFTGSEQGVLSLQAAGNRRGGRGQVQRTEWDYLLFVFLI